MDWVELTFEMVPTCIRMVDKPCSEMEPRCHDCRSAQLMVSREVKPCPDCGQTTGHYDDCPIGMGVTP